MTVARLLQKGGYYTGMIGKWHLGSDPVGFDRWEILPGQGVYANPVFYTATGETTYTGRYATDVITDLAIDFMEKRPRNQPFFLMVHHKAPHRPWQPDAAHAAQFAARRIPEPVTFWDSYATRTDALHENQQRVAADLTRRDLKLEPPAGLAGAELTSWLATKPDTVTIVRDGKSVTLTGEPLVALEIPALHAGLPGDRPVRGRQRRPPARPTWTATDSRRTRSSSTRATRGSSSAITACSTSASCTKNRCACRFSFAGRLASSAARGAARSR